MTYESKRRAGNPVCVYCGTHSILWMCWECLKAATQEAGMFCNRMALRESDAPEPEEEVTPDEPTTVDYQEHGGEG